MQTNAVPLLNSDQEAEGPMANTDPTCPVCKRKLVDQDDPAEAGTVRDFLRRSHAADPQRYHAVLTAHAVNANVNRDEKSHEIPLDAIVDAEAELTLVDLKAYRDWFRQQFS